MKQREIQKLLEEAAHPDCTRQRRNEIQCALGQLIVENAEQTDGFSTLFNGLWTSTVQNRPSLFPSLFPVFALLCGERGPTDSTTDIDWTLVR